MTCKCIYMPKMLFSRKCSRLFWFHFSTFHFVVADGTGWTVWLRMVGRPLSLSCPPPTHRQLVSWFNSIFEIVSAKILFLLWAPRGYKVQALLYRDRKIVEKMIDKKSCVYSGKIPKTDCCFLISSNLFGTIAPRNNQKWPHPLHQWHVSGYF